MKRIARPLVVAVIVAAGALLAPGKSASAQTEVDMIACCDGTNVCCCGGWCTVVGGKAYCY